MVRDAGGVTLSSIALLQERFRQLQRMKELRQERELIRTLSESERCAVPTPALPMRRDQPPPPARLALSLWPDSDQTKQAESWATKAEAPSHAAHLLPTHFNPDNDIDTSLRL